MKIVWWTIKYATEDGKEHYVSEVPDWVADDVDEFLNHLEEETVDRVEEILKGRDEAMQRFTNKLNEKECE